MQPDLKLTPEMFQPAPDNFKDAEKIQRRSISYWADVWRRLRLNKLAMLGMFTIVGLVIMAIIGPMISGHTYYEQDFASQNIEPGDAKFWFGTDGAGRDLFTRAWYGARISLFIGFMAAFLDFVIGVVYGGISGLKGGRIDNIMMRIAEVLYGIPYLLMVILLMVVMGPGLWTIIIAMSLTGWIPMARLVRGQVLQLKELEYVHASMALGAGTWWVLKKHIIPNTMGPILVNMTLTIPTAIFNEATLSFLGLGIPAPKASWGTMASDSLDSLLIGTVYQLFIPGLLISLAMFAFNVFGDGLRDALDPRMRK
ncbi:ABC transporter permease [Aneurinibacillus tyrosinisolvens]|uniref:ABC transporter permease n=1 Tax=Aneurinibacillus tyrosinisolvens TaxID=1443435 RepID=UPI00069C2A53|nr:ABC transporter permease [Aneurinibacillus tyrosinisolvens]